MLQTKFTTNHNKLPFSLNYSTKYPYLVAWLLAAEQGYVNAQYNLGLMYSIGEGVPQNNVRAYVWFSVAAAQGNEDARTNRDIISDRLTPEQLARGQDMATSCFESEYQDCE